MPHRFNPLATAPAHPGRPTVPRSEPVSALALSVIIVNFRRRTDTVNLVNQLDKSEALRCGQAEVVLIDNDEDGQPLQRWVMARPGVQLRNLGRNRGFARAVNAGCKLGRGEWLLLLNPDVSVPDEFIDQVLVAAEQLSATDPRVGVIGFELWHADGSPQPSAGPFPTLNNVVTGLVRSRAKRRCRPRDAQAMPVPWATGCCLLVRRTCWQELGGFDEDFFLYYEDVDLCRRARANGWNVWYEPGLNITHYHPLHSRDVPPPMRIITRHALLTYAAKHWPAWQFRALTAMVSLEAKLRGYQARLAGRRDEAGQFQRLGRIAADLRRGRVVRARAEVLAAARALAVESRS